MIIIPYLTLTCPAVNGDSIVNKVRFVAVTQLEALEQLSSRTAELAPDFPLGADGERDRVRLQSAQNYLCEWSNVMEKELRDC